jgi:hypothetical protein
VNSLAYEEYKENVLAISGNTFYRYDNQFVLIGSVEITP